MPRCRICAYLLCCLIFLSHYAHGDDPAALITLKLTHPPANPTKNLRPVSLLEFSADGSHLVAATYETATLWNLATRKPAFDSPPRRPGPNPGGINVFATNGGAFFVLTEGKGNFTLYDTTTGAARGPARFPPQQASGFPIVPETVISRDGKWMAGAFNNHPWGSPQGVVNGKPLPLEPCRVILFDARTGAPRHTWKPRTKAPVVDPAAAPQPPQDAPFVFALSFSPDGHYLATATTDGNVAVFDTAAGREIGFFNEWDERKRLAPTPRELRQDMFTWMDDGKSLIMPATLQHELTPCWTVTGQTVRDVRWPAETPSSVGPAIAKPPDAPNPPPTRPRSHFPTPTEQMRESREHLEGKPTGPASGDDARHPGEVAWEAFSPDGHYAVFAFGDGNTNVFAVTSRISVADLSAGKNLGSVPGIPGAITPIRFSPDSRKVAWGTQDGTVYVIPIDALIAMAKGGQPLK